MGAAVDALQKRLVAGGRVSASQLAKAEAEDRLAERVSELEASAAARCAESQRLADVDKLIKAFAADVDKASVQLRATFDRTIAARDELERQTDELDALAAGYTDRLRALGCSMQLHEVLNRTDGRVLYSSDHVHQPHQLMLPTGHRFFNWRRTRIDERNGIVVELDEVVDPRTGVVRHVSRL